MSEVSLQRSRNLESSKLLRNSQFSRCGDASSTQFGKNWQKHSTWYAPAFIVQRIKWFGLLDTETNLMNQFENQKKILSKNRKCWKSFGTKSKIYRKLLTTGLVVPKSIWNADYLTKLRKLEVVVNQRKTLQIRTCLSKLEDLPNEFMHENGIKNLYFIVWNIWLHSMPWATQTLFKLEKKVPSLYYWSRSRFW